MFFKRKLTSYDEKILKYTIYNNSIFFLLNFVHLKSRFSLFFLLVNVSYLFSEFIFGKLTQTQMVDYSRKKKYKYYMFIVKLLLFWRKSDVCWEINKIRISVIKDDFNLPIVLDPFSQSHDSAYFMFIYFFARVPF